MIRGATILGLLVGTLLAVFVFAIKYDVQDLEAEYETLNRNIEAEQQAIHVLKAEWSYLNEPQRLSELARLYLGTSIMTYNQMDRLQSIPMRESPGSKSFKDPPGTIAAIEAALRELQEQGGGQ